MDNNKENLISDTLPYKGSRKGLWQVADAIDYELLKTNAKLNRSDQTEAESAFWSIVKGSGLGERCRRQYIIGQYIVDFFFRKSLLIVELDGGYHFTEEQQKEDAIRQDWLEHQGYKVIRFKNEEILFDTDNVISRIKALLSTIKDETNNNPNNEVPL